ncbi:hypothetical protein SAMN05660226_03990 [Parapedobacter luteus]|uniref:Uncharacterized protein n=1 Tax=Parapedobacter luteus TaxID=623280 RepID=A0A1T5FI44_9SPHI|nr:hypothetical protein [Parapedobacter luteus]SKB95748.1 hypothetical protein SAMN05660226_03990 [Parapedobacter luteus]
MLLKKIAEYLDDKRIDFSYIKDGPRMEIWVAGKEWLPILVFKGNNDGYFISWCGIEYRIADEIKAYVYVLRIFTAINELRIQEKQTNRIS